MTMDYDYVTKTMPTMPMYVYVTCFPWVVGQLVRAVVAIAIATGHSFSFHAVTFCCGSRNKNLFASFR